MESANSELLTRAPSGTACQPRRSCLLVALCAAVLWAQPVAAQVPIVTPHQFANQQVIFQQPQNFNNFQTVDPALTPLQSEINNGVYDPLRNIFFRLRHVAGQQAGDIPSFSSFGASHYQFFDAGLLMTDGQIMITNDGELGANLGVVGRTISGDTVLGAGIWFDLRQMPTENVYQEISLSLEMLREDWKFRTNVYYPVGATQRITQRTLLGNPGGGLGFLGNNIISGGILVQNTETALEGVDVEVARTLNLLYGIDAFLGGFHLKKGAVNTNGVKTGMRGFVLPDLAAEVTLSYDEQFGANVFGGLTMFFGGSGIEGRPTSLNGLLTSPVVRNEQVAVNDQEQLISDLVVFTNGGNPITVTHISSAAVGTGDGTAETPFSSLTAAAGSTNNIVYVHANSIFTNQNYVVSANQRLLGEANGIVHQVTTDQGVINLPRATTGMNRPILRSALAGSSILTVTTGNEISGFVLDGLNSANFGIVGGNAMNTNINQSIVQNFTQGGIVIVPSVNTTINQVVFNNNAVDVLLNASNTTITNVTSNNSQSSIQLGTPSGDITGTAVLTNIDINNVTNSGIVLNNAQAGADIDLTNVDVDGAPGATSGILVTNAQAGVDIDVNTFAVSDIAGPGVSIMAAGPITVDFNNGTITNTMTNGFVTNNSTLALNNVTVNTVGQGTGIRATDSTVTLTGVTVQNVTATGAGVFGDGLFANNSNVTVTNSMFTNIANDGIDIRSGANNINVALSNNTFNVGDEGIDLNTNGAGILTATINDNMITANDNAFEANIHSTGNLQLSFNRNTLTSNQGAAAIIDGRDGTGTLFVNQFADNTVIGTANGERGLLFNQVTFQGNVNAGTTNIGTAMNRVQGDGLRLIDVNGQLTFNTLNIFSDGTNAGPPPATPPGLTIVIDFIDMAQGNVMDPINAVTLNPFDVTQLGFAAGDFAMVTDAIFQEVVARFRNIPTEDQDSRSAIGEDMELDIDFVMGNLGTAPVNGATTFHYLLIGDTTTNLGGLFGQSAGIGQVVGGPSPAAPNGSVAAAVYEPSFVALPQLTAGNLALTRTAFGNVIAHEAGHALSLFHIAVAGSETPNGLAPMMSTPAADLPFPGGLFVPTEFAFSGVNNFEPGSPAMQRPIEQLATNIGLRQVNNDPATIGDGLVVQANNSDFTLNINGGTIDVTNGTAGIRAENLQSLTVSNTTINGNQTNWTGISATQTNLAAGVTAPTTVTLSNNTINTTAGTGQTAISVSNNNTGAMGGAMNLNVSGNNVNFASAVGTIGINLNADGAGGNLVLSGAANNVVTGSGTDFQSTTANGATINNTIQVNGMARP